LFIYFTFVLA